MLVTNIIQCTVYVKSAVVVDVHVNNSLGVGYSIDYY